MGQQRLEVLIKTLLITLTLTEAEEKKMDMSVGSVDDRYSGCKKEMWTELVGEEGLLKSELRDNADFEKAWGVHSCESPTLRQELTQALAAYRFGGNIFRLKFNAAVESQGGNDSSYLHSFKYKSLHFLLTEALDQLRGKGPCNITFRGSEHNFEADIGSDVRFGRFTSVVSERGEAEEIAAVGDYGTVFSIASCGTVDISPYTCGVGPIRLLIPPHEVFKVVDVRNTDEYKLITLAHKQFHSYNNCSILRLLSGKPSLRGLWLILAVSLAVSMQSGGNCTLKAGDQRSTFTIRSGEKDRRRNPNFDDMMEPVSLPALSRVAVCGGTHGNELSGVCLVRDWLQKREAEKPEPFSLEMVLSNPRAMQQCTRYVQRDLNRCFTTATLSAPILADTPYEVGRAQELNSLLGPRGSSQAVDLLCDLHNTTSNMGLCVICYSDCNWICLHIYKHLQRVISSVPVRFIQLETPLSEAYSLDSVGKNAFSIEVGPQPHGVVRADMFNAMKEGVEQMLDWVRHFNTGTKFEGGEVELYTVVKKIDYPRDPETDTITAMIHPQLQDRDFGLLRPGDPLFLSFSGETQRYEGEEPLYPFFVNEGAYYEKGVALCLARLKRVEIPPVQRINTALNVSRKAQDFKLQKLRN